jgi:CheY-like chemotaxis protein
VGVALTGAEALRRAGELQPDLALVDIMLAEESGFECARDLIEHDRDGGPAVILISTHAEADFADLITAARAEALTSLRRGGRQTFEREVLAICRSPTAVRPLAGDTHRLPSRS